MPTTEYDFSFANGPGDWWSWLRPSVITGAAGAFNSFTRLQAPGQLDSNHIDGIGPIWLVSHLPSPSIGAPGSLDLTGATIDITIKTSDFVANGAKLYFWVTSEIPGTGITESYFVGLQGTNWAFTGEDLASQLTSEWQTLSVTLDTNPANWTYAGNNVADQGDWGRRYEFYDLAPTLANVNQTLHLVLLGASVDQKPTGFLDIADIKITTQTPATPFGLDAADFERINGIEDTPATGFLVGDPNVVTAPTNFSLVAGSVQNGSVSINPVSGAYVFTPDADFFGGNAFNGPGEFKYIVSNATQTSTPITVIVTVAPINDAPHPFALSENVTNAGTGPLNFALRLGTDADLDILTYQVVAGSVSGGTLALNAANGRYTFTPNAGFTGNASFQYIVSDGQLTSEAKTVTLQILSNPAPLPSFDAAITPLLGAGDFDGYIHEVIRYAHLGDLNAAYHYGTLLNYGDYLNEDTIIGAQYLAAAVGTVDDASIQLAALYVQGNGVVRNYAAAHALLSDLPDNAEALYRLGLLNELGFGAVADPVIAAQNFHDAAERGHAAAAYTLGRRYLVGEGVAQDFAQAYFWLGLGLRLAQPGDPAIDNLLISFNLTNAAANLSISQIFALDQQVADWVSPFSTSNPAGITLTGSGVLIGGAFNDHLTGGNASDTLLGFGGNDVLTGGAIAANTLQGGTGDDTYIVELSGDTLFELDGEGIDTVIALSPDLTLRDHLENLIYLGTANFTGTGNSAANEIRGDVGDDVLNGAGGDDLLFGGNGNDRLIGGSGNNGLNGGSGIDIADYSTAPIAVKINLATSSSANGQGGIDVLTEIEAIIGSDYADTLIGNGADNILSGGLGSDYLIGQGGNDRLIGGAGSPNTLQGGTGDDVYVVELANNTIIEFAGEGIDTVETSSGSATLRTNVENLTFIGSGSFNGFGNTLANVIQGGTAADFLSGNDGDDVLIGGTGAANTLIGGAGNDVYRISAIGDSAIEAAGGGNDRVETTLASHVLRNQVEALTFIGNGNFTGIGNTLANQISGGAGADFLSGLDGDDILLGRQGADFLIGGAGADVFQFDGSDNSVDRIFDFQSGTDKIALLSSAFAHTLTISYVAGSTATSTNSTFIYNQTTGRLSFDADGTGSGAAIGVADLGANLTLAAGDFIFY